MKYLSPRTERLVNYEEWLLRQANEGLAQINRGEVRDHQEVVARMEELIAKKPRQG
jgi:predicted transcriptional regulator